MKESSVSRVSYAVHQGTYVLKLVGDIRVTCCATLDSFIEDMLADSQMAAVVVDLSETTIIDSTALGLLAKIAVFFRRSFDIKPVIISTRPDVDRILDSMGFDSVFNIVHEQPVIDPALADLPDKNCTEACATEKVLEAHKVLMSMNAKNAETFRDLVNTLQEQSARAASSSNQGGLSQQIGR
ncbi:MAG: anti-anti-sigma factor [Gammaproteobacteria bacterium]|nr:MAG: anti-anti-sigma factor [Gammaproteobacteria bacterium]